MSTVVIDGVEYVPISQSNQNVEQIARGIMEQFWGKVPDDWEHEANSLFVHIDEDSCNDPSVMEVVGRIVRLLSVPSE